MTELSFMRSERGSTCPDCGYQMQPGEVNEHMNQHVMLQQMFRAQIYVPVTAQGAFVVDNGGDAVAQCITPEIAAKIAELINRDALP